MRTSSLVLFFIAILIKGFCQAPQVGIIDFYGSANNQDALRNCIPFSAGDTIHFLNETDYTKTKSSIERCLRSKPGVAEAQFGMVCCYTGGTWMIFVGANSQRAPIRREAKTQDIRISPSYLLAYDSLMALNMEAVQLGQASEDGSSGHAITSYPPCAKIQKAFVAYADRDLQSFRKVLSSSRHAHDRAAAADIIAYYSPKRVIVPDLIAAVEDADEEVRNNAMRALGIIVPYARNNPGENIRIAGDAFIRMLNSISWTDRNKSSFVLLELTRDRPPDLLQQLRLQAVDALQDMALWKSEGHAMPGFTILGRVAGWTDKQTQEAIHKDRPGAVAAMLRDIRK